MTTPVEGLLDALARHGCPARRAGNGWSARCPAHEDRRASLSIAEGDDGRALVRCHAGCEPSAIVEALGLTMQDLMPADGGGGPRRNGRPQAGGGKAAGNAKGVGSTKTNKVYATPEAAIEALVHKLGQPSAKWEYHDASGDVVGLVVRWDTPSDKTIRPVSRTPAGWVCCGMPEPRPLYRLPELAATERVYVVEGEKCAEAAWSIGLVATTSPHGAQAARKTDWSPLAGKSVVILPDHDDAGHKYADDVAAILGKLDPPATVRIVELPGLGDKEDLADWIAARAGIEPQALRQELERLADVAPVWIPATKPEPDPVLTCLADVEPRDVSWLWPGRIPLGRITLLVGRPGEGKSFVTIDAAARVTTGTPWPDGGDCPQGSVILISAEDDPADTIRPRLDAHYADNRRVHLLSGVRRSDGDGHYERIITLADLDAIEAALRKLPDCKLIVVDPIGSYLGGGTDAHRDNEVRSVLAPIAKLAEKHGVAVLVVAHRRKSAGTNADDLALGSRAFTGIARAVWHLTRDPENKARRLLLPGKNNLAREGVGLAFTIFGEPARIAWERDPVAMNADDALAAENQFREKRPGPDAEVLEGALAWLESALAAGPRRAKELLEEWKNGEGGSERTLKRAKKSLNVEAYREEVPGPWWWRLPAKDAKPAEDVQLGPLGILAKNRANATTIDANDAKGAKLPKPGLHDDERAQVTI